jgi:hypothetical protein
MVISATSEGHFRMRMRICIVREYKVSEGKINRRGKIGGMRAGYAGRAGVSDERIAAAPCMGLAAAGEY